VANVLGPLFAYETLTAFFLEAGFIGIVLFGEGRVSKGLHFFSCCMVRAARWSQRPGSSPPTAGCRRPQAPWPTPMASITPSTGGR
jgi:Cytochrome bd terminal oxidase subunit I